MRRIHAGSTLTRPVQSNEIVTSHPSDTNRTDHQFRVVSGRMGEVRYKRTGAVFSHRNEKEERTGFRWTCPANRVNTRGLLGHIGFIWWNQSVTANDCILIEEREVKSLMSSCQCLSSHFVFLFFLNWLIDWFIIVKWDDPIEPSKMSEYLKKKKWIRSRSKFRWTKY